MRFSKELGGALLLGLAALTAPHPAEGQFETGQWRAAPVFAINTYDDATPFKTTVSLGGELFFTVSRNFSLGLSTRFSRPEVDGSYFPLAQFQVSADTVVLFEAGYQATELTYAGMVQVGVPLSNWYLYAQGGAGGYTFWMDRQAFRDVQILTRRTNTTGLLFPLGAGVAYSVSNLIGIRLEVRDEIFADFNREDFNPVAEGRFRNTCEVEDFCIREANADTPDPKSTVHNFRFSIGFEFTPGR